jgi:small subunit ribosomal protein S3
MGQKINPIGFRMGISRDWTAKWYAGTKSYTQNLLSDIALRDYLKLRLKNAALSTIVIERPAQSINITVHTARPGIVIGKKGEDIEKLRQEMTKIAGRPVQLDAQLVSENIAQQLEKRIMFRRAMKRAVTNAMRLRALGIKVMVAGRLNGAEIARTEWYREGRVPLHTLRADIDYGFSEAQTTYGKIGVKVWIFKGEVFDKDAPKTEDAEAQKKGATAG